MANIKIQAQRLAVGDIIVRSGKEYEVTNVSTYGSRYLISGTNGFQETMSGTSTLTIKSR